jgi:large subunit ribosomal protein L10
VKDWGNFDCPSVLTSMARQSFPSARREPTWGAGCKCRPAWSFFPEREEIERDGRHQPGGFPRQRTANRRELLDRAAKSELVGELGEVFKATKVVVVAHYSGLTVAQMQTLRRQMKQAGAQVKVAKNRLAKIALEGSEVASIAPLLKGPALIAYSSDPVTAPKVASDFAKTNEKFIILGGAMGKTSLDPNGVKALAALPSLDELRAKILGLLVAPATKIAQLANAPAAKVARVVQAYASKTESAAA